MSLKDFILPCETRLSNIALRNTFPTCARLLKSISKSELCCGNPIGLEPFLPLPSSRTSFFSPHIVEPKIGIFLESSK